MGWHHIAAYDILKHPWITRKKYDDIPKSLSDKMSQKEYESILKQKIIQLYFISYIKQVNDGEYNFFSEEFFDYKNKVLMISDKIQQWHIGMKAKHNTEFINDADF